MKIIIVDDNDRVIDVKERDELDYAKDIYRVSAIWVTNSHGQVLLAKRALSKKHDPGVWGPAVAGTIEEGETYRSNILKEIREELGVDDIAPKESKKVFVDDGHRYFTQWFMGNSERQTNRFFIEESEVAEVKWFSRQEIIEVFNKNPTSFIPSFKTAIALFLN
jgi:isopentenyl-diphosphate delta-isomerase